MSRYLQKAHMANFNSLSLPSSPLSLSLSFSCVLLCTNSNYGLNELILHSQNISSVRIPKQYHLHWYCYVFAQIATYIELQFSLFHVWNLIPVLHCWRMANFVCEWNWIVVLIEMTEHNWNVVMPKWLIHASAIITTVLFLIS